MDGVWYISIYRQQCEMCINQTEEWSARLLQSLDRRVLTLNGNEDAQGIARLSRRKFVQHR